MTGVSVLITLLVLLMVMLGWILITFNKLVRQRNQVQSAGAQIDVQLTRRHTLIPNLVETVKGYAAHERATLDAVVAARATAVRATDAGPARRGEAEGELSQVLGRLMAISESYPDLKANHNFLALQRELSATEDKIAYARQFFNNAVQTLNSTIQTVPSNLVARIGRFTEHQYFQATGDERQAQSVRF